jgi:predicted thioesterase
MKATLTAGISVSREFGIDRERTIDFMGDRARVYATPMMVRDIEVTCREFLLAHLDPGEDSVGTRVEVDHLAPTLLGMTVAVEAKVTEVKGRLITFEVSVHDGVDQVGRGRHLRYVIEMKAQEQRLAAKAEKAGVRR